MPGGRERLMFSPTSAMMAWAPSRPMPLISSRRATAASGAAAGSVGPGLAAGAAAAGMSSISCVTRAVNASILAVSASTSSSSMSISSARCSWKRPVSASFSSARLGRSLPKARSAWTSGSRSPAASASSIARPDLPKMSLATVDSLIKLSSSSFLDALLVPGAVLGLVDPQPG